MILMENNLLMSMEIFKKLSQLYCHLKKKLCFATINQIVRSMIFIFMIKTLLNLPMQNYSTKKSYTYLPFLLCLVVQDLGCHAWAFSNCVSGGILSCGAWASRCSGFSLQSMGCRACRLRSLWHVGAIVAFPSLQSTSPIVVAHGLSCLMTCGIFLDQELSP